jgi:glycosyltransferase involved in cell wall biosynthesis
MPKKLRPPLDQANAPRVWPWIEEPGTEWGERISWPKISVVTISYNQGEFLEASMRSVLLQDYPNLEYIVIDGGSTDNSLETIKHYAGHLTFWCSESDPGPTSALNKGFDKATGDIFAFLNADDMYLQNTLKRAVELFEQHPTADVIYGDGYLTDSSGVLRYPTYSDPWNLKRLAYGTCILVQPSTFFRAEAYHRTQGFNESHRNCWDATLWTDMALVGARFHHEKDFLSVFRLHHNSITGSRREDAEGKRVMDEIFEKIIGRHATKMDRVLSLWLRFIKFAHHPRWTIKYRLFRRSIQQPASESQ